MYISLLCREAADKAVAELREQADAADDQARRSDKVSSHIMY